MRPMSAFLMRVFAIRQCRVAIIRFGRRAHCPCVRARACVRVRVRERVRANLSVKVRR